MGEQDQAEDDVAELERPPLTGARARAVTAGLREAMDDVRRTVAVLAVRVRDAHAARVWLALSHPSWEAYCVGEFGISRAQAYRLLDVARGLGAIQAGVAAGTLVSRTRDSTPVAEAALDYGLSQRALIAVAARSGDITELITGRLAALTRDGAQDLDAATVRAVVHQAVRDVRATPPEPPDAPPADTGVAELRRVVDDLAASALTMGELFLEVAPAYLSDGAAADVLGPLCAAIGEDLDTGLATRRYALTGDRRALHGTVL
ncbi:hypothetical protein [Streptomyces sp. NBC_01264]|uniref:hypothetical protein n=1 Tax=Streptomyces sp. NBC_01264 TaxID=2903804 RepID=UPI002253C110|nr:hypothetical protein [Streptomyces sp. NBC_01264]MCX4784496.1 hypothetical protein [Streptomyces sp. NBC_01264]